MSIAQAVIVQVENIAKQERASRVVYITLMVGAISRVSTDALEMVFPLAAEKTVAEDSSLVLEVGVTRVLCRSCKEESSPELPSMVCQNCGSTDLEIILGNQKRKLLPSKRRYFQEMIK